MDVRAIRGAITTEHNDARSIISSTKDLLIEVSKQNNIEPKDIISVFFTTTSDLDAVFPAVAARELGWIDTPLMCAAEINVSNSLPKCVRILMHAYSDKDKQSIKHIYLNDAKKLRPDLS